MARKRTKIYKAGDKIQVSLNKNLSPEFLNWINKQSDLTNFFLYGVQQLYAQTGDIDVSKIMPRNIDIDYIPTVPKLTNTENTSNVSTDEDVNIEENIQENDTKELGEQWESMSKVSFEGDQFS